MRGARVGLAVYRPQVCWAAAALVSQWVPGRGIMDGKCTFNPQICFLGFFSNNICSLVLFVDLSSTENTLLVLWFQVLASVCAAGVPGARCGLLSESSADVTWAWLGGGSVSSTRNGSDGSSCLLPG